MSNPPALKGTALEKVGVVITRMALRINDPRELTWAKIEEIGNFLGDVGIGYPFWVGDLILTVEEVFGMDSPEASQIEVLFPHSPHTLKNYRWVARAIPPARRRDGVGFGVHEAVAALEPHERDAWLKRAADEGWKREEMRWAIRAARERGELSRGSGPVDDPVVTSSARSEGELVLGPQRFCPHCGNPI